MQFLPGVKLHTGRFLGCRHSEFHRGAAFARYTYVIISNNLIKGQCIVIFTRWSKGGGNLQDSLASNLASSAALQKWTKSPPPPMGWEIELKLEKFCLPAYATKINYPETSQSCMNKSRLSRLIQFFCTTCTSTRYFFHKVKSRILTNHICKHICSLNCNSLLLTGPAIM